MVESDGADAEIETPLTVKKCAAEDWDAFFDPVASSKNRFDKIKKLDQAWCIDKTNPTTGEPNDLRVWGSSESMPHRRLDIELLVLQIDRIPIRTSSPDHLGGEGPTGILLVQLRLRSARRSHVPPL